MLAEGFGPDFPSNIRTTHAPASAGRKGMVK
jgi:hypothetical protein